MHITSGFIEIAFFKIGITFSFFPAVSNNARIFTLFFFNSFSMCAEPLFCHSIERFPDIITAFFRLKSDSIASFLPEHANDKNKIKKGKNLYQFVVDKSDFSIDNRRFRFGKGAAFFYRSSDTIRLKLKNPNFFSNHIDTGPFTFEFWLHPFSGQNGQVIFQKFGPVYSGNRIKKYSGVKVYFHNGKIVWEFYNIFRTNNLRTRYARVRISSRMRIPLHKWKHHALSYNPLNGKLTYYINGRSVNTVFCTDTGQADDTVLVSSFHPKEYGMLIIGKNYSGLIDEFAIFSKLKHSYNLNRYVSKIGLIRSSVIDLHSNGTTIQSVKVKYSAARGSDIVLEYRISNRYYENDKPETMFPWREYNLEQPLQNGVIRGRYFQWRIKLLGSENGRYSPIVNNVIMNFTADRVPFRPLGLQAVSFNKKIYLTWRGSTEPDVVGYKIYYGRAPRVYNGTLSMEGFSPLQVPVSRLRNRLMPRFELSGLRVNHLYYITITAYDKSGQESAFAKEVFVRIKRFRRRASRGIFSGNR